MKKSKNILISFLAFLFSILVLSAQPEKFFDTKGTDFWLTYIPNYHNYHWDNFEPELQRGDSLYIFITSNVPTRGEIDFTDRQGGTHKNLFSITNPEDIYTFKVAYNDYELFGFNESGRLGNRNQSERVSNLAFHVSSQDEVSVYAHSQANTTSEAFMVLPTDVLGKDYFVMAYNSDGSAGGGGISAGSTPSQFAIVATENNTNITITPSTPTYANGLSVQDIQLNKGEVYLVQALIAYNNYISDLTGSQIQSDKPVAVFAGHQRATVPYYSNYSVSSRDCLIEQMVPVANWGQNAFLVPYQKSPDESSKGNDLYRVIAAYDNTEINITDESPILLNKGEFHEGLLLKPSIVSANAPILVAQYKKTAQDASGSRPLGDPFMMLIPPKEQFMNSYRVINAQTYEYDFYRERYFPVYQLQYINVVIPNDAISSLKIDGNSVDKRLFKAIPTSDYSYANIPVTDGVHEVKADGDFGIFIYGYGEANSYGYLGGMSLKPFDFEPPKITFNEECYEVSGIVYDSSMNDSGIKEVKASANNIVNVIVDIETFTPYRDSVKYSANLADNRQDGSFTLAAVDSMNYISSKTIEIPGFTLAIESFELPTVTPLEEFTIRINKKHCLTYYLTNYGKFPQKIDDFHLSVSDKFYIETPAMPPMIMPGEKYPFTICFESADDSVYLDSLILFGECSDKILMTFRAETVTDREPPSIYSEIDSCKSSMFYVVTDTLLTDFGIDKTTVLSSENCDIEIVSISIGISTITVDIVDPYQDAYYIIEISDLMGNMRTISDTIPGFTLSITAAGPTGELDFGEHSVGYLNCDSLMVHNYGNFILNIDQVYLQYNILFSLPQSQLPLILLPGESRTLAVCYRPFKANEFPDRDTLKFLNSCYNKTVPLSGLSAEIIDNGTTRCNTGLILTTSAVPESFFVEQNYPNPIYDRTVVRIAAPEKGKISINVFDALGILRKSSTFEITQPGIYEAELDLSELPSGTYFCSVSTHKYNSSVMLTIQR